MPGMRVAKATNEDFETTRKFLHACENFWDNRRGYSFSDKETEWKEWDEEDEDKIELLKIRRDLAQEEHCDEEDVDNRLILFEYLKKRYRQCDCHWGRVVMAADVLIDNVCDPTESHLSFHPMFESFHVTPEQ